MAGRPSRKPSVGRRRAKPRKKTTPLVFTRNGVTIRHIDIPTEQLPAEVAKLQGKLHEAFNRLARMPRIKHVIVQAARFKLAKTIASFPASLTMTPDQAVAEIGRYNFVLADTAKVLARMKSNFHELDEARFTLRFGQTAVKRVAGWNSFKKDRTHIESIPDPEGAPELDE
jgi:hypothetical protein